MQLLAKGTGMCSATVMHVSATNTATGHDRVGPGVPKHRPVDQAGSGRPGLRVPGGHPVRLGRCVVESSTDATCVLHFVLLVVQDLSILVRETIVPVTPRQEDRAYKQGFRRIGMLTALDVICEVGMYRAVSAKTMQQLGMRQLRMPAARRTAPPSSGPRSLSVKVHRM